MSLTSEGGEPKGNPGVPFEVTGKSAGKITKVTIAQFRQMELKVAVITQAEAHPNADRLLVLTVDVGGAAKQVVAGIRGQYEPSALIGKSVVIVDNLEPATIRGVQSQGMVLAASGGDLMSVLTPDRPVPSGSPVR